MGLIETIRFRIIPSLSSNWKTYVLVLLPLILLPLPVLGNGKEARTGYVIIIMAIYWMTEALPVPITSLLPVVLFPLLGIMDTGKVCTAYMKETNMMFIGGLMVALAIEHCNLHKRTALRVLLLVGASPRWLMLGFMLVTMFLSMWISNTATTAMMVPIVEAVIEELFKENEGFRESPVTSFENTSVDTNLSSENVDCCIDTVGSIDSVADVGKSCLELTPSGRRSTHNPEHKKKIRSGVFMSIAYASNIGGTGSLIGSGPQLALKGILNELYGPAPGLNFASWMAFNIPGMLINTFLAWIWLQYLFIGFKRTTTDEDGKTKVVKNLIKKKYEELGPMTFHEIATLILFIVCVFLWFFRDPQFITGWSEYLHAVEVDDATAVMTIVMFLFIIPAKPKIWWFRNVGEVTQFSESCSALLEWKYVQDKLPWGVVLLLGGGFAISDASKISGLSTWLGAQLSVLSVLPPFIIMLTICIMTAAVTEVASNTATANILLPILSEMANTIQVNPLFLMLPATVTCSYAFMLPVATPPNAIVFAAGKMNQVDMMKTGFFMNIICVFTICVLTVSYGSFMFGFEKFPEWALTKLIMNDTMTQMILRSNHTL
ncbi:solute carrier family 13 member 5-like isoform X1 [Daphnia pulex]|uniref:solute carrier family 13 member 5-like isoform X1 n=2 Tax=Daphnia pulex TaxID=6669 RepID=UPI001EDFDBA8|nr:solute carrier family 13 member 5-like isoform X1 [Daphnia pulex]